MHRCLSTIQFLFAAWRGHDRDGRNVGSMKKANTSPTDSSGEKVEELKGRKLRRGQKRGRERGGGKERRRGGKKPGKYIDLGPETMRRKRGRLKIE